MDHTRTALLDNHPVPAPRPPLPQRAARACQACDDRYPCDLRDDALTEQGPVASRYPR